MTSSNETYRKSRLFTGLAIGAAVLAAGVFGYLFVRVNSLEVEFGDLRANRARIVMETSEAAQRSAELAVKISELTDEQNELEPVVEEARRLQVKLEDLRMEKTQAEAIIANRDNSQEQLDALRRDLSKLQSEINDLMIAFNNLGDDKADAQKQLKDERNKLKIEQSKAQKLRESIRKLTDEAADLNVRKYEKEQAEKARDVARDDESTARANTTELVSQANVAKGRLDTATKSLRKIEEALGELREERAELEVDLAQLTQEKLNYEERAEPMRTEENRLKGINAVLKQVESDLEGKRIELRTAEKELLTGQTNLETVGDLVAEEQQKLAEIQIKRSGEDQRLKTAEEVFEDRDRLLSLLKEQIAREEGRKEDLKNVLAELIVERDALRAAQRDRQDIETEIAERHLQLAELNKQPVELAGIKQEISDRKAELSKIQEELSEEKVKLESELAARARLALLKAEAARFSDLGAQIVARTAERDGLEATVAKFDESQKLAAAETEMERATLQGLRERVEVLAARRDELQPNVDDLEKRRIELMNKITRHVEEEANTKKIADAEQTRLAEIQAKIAAFRTLLSGHEEERNRLLLPNINDAPLPGELLVAPDARIEGEN